MAALSLAEIRAKIQAEEERKKQIQDGTYTGGVNSEPSAFLAHWNIKEGASLNLRFLPDGDNTNEVFWRERVMIKLPFKGIAGVSNDMVFVSVPCNEMFEGQPINSCPIRKEVREWYALMKTDPSTKTKDFEDQASKYWGSKQYLLQCLIAPNSTPVLNDNAPENPIRRVLLSKGLFNKVRGILMNPDVEELPTSYEKGRDFRIFKSKNSGGFASYDESQFAMSERPLTQEERDAIEKYGLENLGDFIPKQPTAEELEIIAEMFAASVNGEPYDPARWAEFYRPAGVARPTTTTARPVTPAAQVTPAPQAAPVQSVVQEAPVQHEAAPAASTPEVKTKSDTRDLLARLQNRSK